MLAALAGGRPLYKAYIRSADHSDIACRPGLSGAPLYRVVAILSFENKRVEISLGVEASSNVLRNEHISSLRIRARLQSVTTSVWRALQYYRILAVRIRAIDVRRQPNAVAHRNHNLVVNLHTKCRL